MPHTEKFSAKWAATGYAPLHMSEARQQEVKELAAEKGLLDEMLAGWRELGYSSRHDALKGAAALWQAFAKDKLFDTKDQCETITRGPKVWAMGRFIL